MPNPWILNGRFVVNKDIKRLGGMATVYRAMDLKSEKPVAIKLFDQFNLKPELTKEAYQRDLKSLTDLNSHNNIAKFIDYGDDPESGYSYIVIEWLEKNILSMLKERPVNSWNDFYIHYGRPILQALSFAHRRDIVHRDIKPDNLLFTSNDELRVVDFGICKFKSWFGSNVTFADWKSAPYSPPENDSLHYVNTRDVYGFAAVAVACLEGRELNADENLLNILEQQQNIDDAIRNVLIECLSEAPEDRPQSIDEVIDTIDRVSSVNRQIYGNLNSACYLELTKSAISKMQLFEGVTEKSSIETIVSGDLNEVCGIERTSDNSEQYSFYAGNYVYRVAVEDPDKRYFLIIGISKPESWRLENARQNIFIPSLVFNVGKPPASKIVIDSTNNVLDALVKFESEADERNKQYEKDRLIETWRAQLRLQFDLEKIARNEITYKEFEVNEGEIEFTVGAGEWMNLIGQDRIVSTTGKTDGCIVHIHDATKDKLFGVSDNLNVDAIPISGTLLLDTSRQAASRIRQEHALDDVIFDRANRADLKKILLDPSLAQKPNSILCDEFFQEDLDERKKEIVSAVLGTDDIIVVQGPPGTGKTKLIAEIVLQTIKHDPCAKVLISSQTHNALDNALEKIRSVKNDDKNLNAVRIARQDDVRVSPAVKDLMLGNLVNSWLKNIKLKSAKYLEAWSESNGIDKSEVELGLAVKTLRERLDNYDHYLAQREEVDLKIKNLEKLILEYKKKDVVPEDLALNEFNKDKATIELREIEGSVIQARRKMREAQRDLSNNFNEDGQYLSSLDSNELEEWESAYLTNSAINKKCKDIIELLQDWYERFGRSDDFYAAYLSDSSIVAATCVGIGPKSYKDIKYDLCIIDEASKATPTETLLPIVKSKKWVIVGDPAQLPPYVEQGAVNGELLRKHNLSEADLKKTLLDHFIEKLPNEAILPLRTQYRMCPEIGGLISSTFYDGELSTGRGSAVRFSDYLAIPKPVVWYCTSKKGNRFESRDGDSYINRFESNYIITVLKRFNFAALQMNKTFSVCVLSFYSSQEEIIRKNVARIEMECPSLTIMCGTVDSFQGREADICIISITRCNAHNNMGFVNDLNRVNVALSRGKDALVIVGDSNFCYSSGNGNPFEKVVDYINNHHDDCKVEAV